MRNHTGALPHYRLHLAPCPPVSCMGSGAGATQPLDTRLPAILALMEDQYSTIKLGRHFERSVKSKKIKKNTSDGKDFCENVYNPFFDFPFEA